MKINIPGRHDLIIKYILLDYNGTVAVDGALLDLENTINKLSDTYKVYILTGNTFGGAKTFKSAQLIETKTAEAKLDFMTSLGAEHCIAIGNGVIDHLMLKEAALSIAVIGREGCATKAILSSDLVVTDINDAFSMILNSKKIIAGLRL